jgi:hypothetical protein
MRKASQAVADDGIAPEFVAERRPRFEGPCFDADLIAERNIVGERGPAGDNDEPKLATVAGHIVDQDAFGGPGSRKPAGL